MRIAKTIARQTIAAGSTCTQNENSFANIADEFSSNSKLLAIMPYNAEPTATPSIWMLGILEAAFSPA